MEEERKYKCKKKGYPTRNIAKHHKRRLQRKKKKPYTVYFCEECQVFHLTSMGTQQSRDYRNFLQNQKRNEENE